MSPLFPSWGPSSINVFIRKCKGPLPCFLIVDRFAINLVLLPSSVRQPASVAEVVT
jgi:hypothetical protein